MSTAMETDAILELNQRIEFWCDEYSQELGQDIAILKREHAIDATDDLRRSFHALEEENRLLNIGVIGQVKSGKSSLLNALVFNGENILPRAATPMTAALTTLTWGERFHAKVDFYSAEDRDNLRAAADAYLTVLEKEREKARAQLQARHQQQSARAAAPDAAAPAVDADSIEKTAHSAAQKNSTLAAAYDQWQRICKTAIDPATLDAMSTLHEDSAEALAGRLHAFVGADGRYMPLTKSVEIFLPLDSLRGIRIIDTPGFNDPVQSREERTTKLLKDCDVVLIVSPAGRFLSSQDIDLMNRLTQKEGIRELVIVASQVDNQLYGNDTKQATLSATLDSITNTLGQHLRNTLIRMKENNPEIGTTFHRLIEQGSENILHTSGICHNLSIRFWQQDQWDSGERKVWENLSTDFPDFFASGNPERSRSNLDLLSNICALHGIVDTARKRKEEILSQRRTSLVKAKAANLSAFHQALLDVCRERKRQLEETDIHTLKQQRKQLDAVMLAAGHDLDGLLDECLADLGGKLRTTLTERLKSAYDEVTDTARSASHEKTETWRVKKSGVGNWIARMLWGGGSEMREEKVLEVYAGHVRAAVETFVTQIGADLHETSDGLIRTFHRNLERNITRVAREHLGDGLDVGMVIRSARGVAGNIQIPEFELGDAGLGVLKTSKTRLHGDEAEKFLDRASSFMADLRQSTAVKITGLAKAVSGLPRTLGGDFFADMRERMIRLEQEIEHKTQTLDRLQRMHKSLAAIEI